MPGKLYIYAQSGPGVGLGHLSRCVRLARVFEGWEVIFYSNDIGARAFLAAKGFNTFRLVDNVEVVPSECDLLIYDTYMLDAAGQKRVAENFARVVRFDDEAEPACHGNELVISSVCRSFDDPRILAGQDYFLLECLDESYRCRDTASRIVMTLGASDDQGSMLRLVRSLPFPVIPVIGPYFKEEDKVALRSECSEVIEGATDLLPVFADADIVITAAGQTLHEAAQLGVPAVVVAISYDQMNNIACYRNIGLKYAGEIGGEDIIEKIVRCVDSLKSKTAREAYSATLKESKPTSGAENIKQAIVRTFFE